MSDDPFDPESNLLFSGADFMDAMVTRLARLLPDAPINRTQNMSKIEVGGERGIVLQVNPFNLDIRLPSIHWDGPATPIPTSKAWLTLRANPLELDDTVLRALLAGARRARMRQFVRCKYCRKLTPPERRDREACHACLSKHEGVVF